MPARLVVRADARLMSIAIENLLRNAWKFTGNNPQTRIELGQLGQNDKGIIYIRDNGSGFDMQYADKLFRPFERLHSPGDFEGSGIGLAIVSRIIRRHGGQVWAEGEMGKGATFYFTL
jgi:light-regulated signal transduction histidine kinase (bacteriophytochrome)